MAAADTTPSDIIMTYMLLVCAISKLKELMVETATKIDLKARPAKSSPYFCRTKLRMPSDQQLAQGTSAKLVRSAKPIGLP